MFADRYSNYIWLVATGNISPHVQPWCVACTAGGVFLLFYVLGVTSRQTGISQLHVAVGRTFPHIRETSKRNEVYSVRKFLSEAHSAVYVAVLLNFAI